MENINLDEIQQVYFGLKTDDVTYISQSKGNDNNNGLSINSPKKSMDITKYSTKYIVIIDGTYINSTNKMNINVNTKNIIGINAKDVIIKYTADYLVSQNVSFYNCTLSVSYAYQGGPINAYNCIIDYWYDGSGTLGNNLINCHIKNFGRKWSYSRENIKNCTYVGSSLLVDNGFSKFTELNITNEIGLNEKTIYSSLKNLGDPSIINPDRTRSNIGITGGPYYFNGFYKNFKGDNVNVEIDTEQNKTRIRIDNVNINPVLSNVGNGIKQKIFKVDENSNLTLLLEKDTPINIGQVKNKDIPLQ